MECLAVGGAVGEVAGSLVKREADSGDSRLLEAGYIVDDFVTASLSKPG